MVTRNPLIELRDRAPNGPWSHRRIHRQGGPCPETLRLAERGEQVLRRDSSERLARVLGVPCEIVEEAAELTARTVRP